MSERGAGDFQKRVLYLRHAQARRAVAELAMTAPDGLRVTFEQAKRKAEQNDKYHAMIDDIAKQTTYAGRKWVADDMKRLLVDEFAEELRMQGKALHHDSRIVPSEDGRRVIQLGIQTSQFYIGEASDFIEWLYAWGSARDVLWSDESKRPVVLERDEVTA